MSVFVLSLRGLLLRGRTAGLAVLPLLIGIAAVLVRVLADEVDLAVAYGSLTANIALSLCVALVGLVQGVSAFNDEREGKTLGLLTATALPRRSIVVAKLAAAWLSTFVLCLPAFFGAIVLGLASPDLASGDVVWSTLLASALASGGYTALFVLLSLLSRRGLLIGLAYVVVWEGTLAGLTTALRNLSVGAYGRRILAAPYAPDAQEFTVADVGVAGAALVLVLLLVGAAALAAWRLPRLDIP